VRSSLIRQEDTIIFNLIERAQFARNDAVYAPGAVPVPPLTPSAAAATASPPAPAQCSLLEYVLRETEKLHGSVRRYTSPDEHAFYPDDLPPLVLPPIDYPSSALHPPAALAVNANGRILRVYLERVLPALTSPGDDSNYGSAATLDVLCLQALSKRIHYGMFVAEVRRFFCFCVFLVACRRRLFEGLVFWGGSPSFSPSAPHPLDRLQMHPTTSQNTHTQNETTTKHNTTKTKPQLNRPSSARRRGSTAR
jgi:hypothetical protein